MFFEDPIANVIYFVGELGWLVGLWAAVVALYAVGSPRLPLVLLVLSGCVLLVFDHPAPYGRSSSVRSFWVPSDSNSRGVGDL